MNSPYQEFALLLAVSALAGFAATRLRQPLIIAYIAVGVAVVQRPEERRGGHGCEDQRSSRGAPVQ